MSGQRTCLSRSFVGARLANPPVKFQILTAIVSDVRIPAYGGSSPRVAFGHRRFGHSSLFNLQIQPKHFTLNLLHQQNYTPRFRHLSPFQTLPLHNCHFQQNHNHRTGR
ncbi:hypothetical protein L596_020857 [Steinernema carpocapsae]|uniref:Uncharacterized protein n=1 Tax=Steinernema carpocapsae TaxID=34508 RepID=A0A4U5MUS3_STECR|nr:hypothetical protein L596_020857 [Steinernema carpocapsae]